MQSGLSNGANEEKPIDKRSERTLNQLTDAMTQLSKEKPVYRITVAELTAKANVSRGTFYLHFTDIYDMYEKIEGYVLRHIDTYFDEYLDAFTDDAYEGFVKKTVEYIDRDRDLFKMLFSMQSFTESMAAYLNRFYREVWAKFLGREINCENWEFFMEYHTYGMLAAFERWLNSEEELTEEKLRELIMILDESFDDMVEKNSR